MKSLLFHAYQSDRQVDWSNFLREAGQWQIPEGGERLSQNVWMLPENPTVEAELARICRRHAITGRCVAIVHKAVWQNLP